MRAVAWIAPVFCGLAGLVLAHHEMILSGFAVTQSDPGDTRLVGYLLEHAFRWVLQRAPHTELWSPPFFYPIKNVGAYADIMLGALPAYAPWRLVGLPPDRAFQAWILTVGALNFASAHLVLSRGFGLRPVPSAIGACLFAFGATRVNMTMHWQLFPHFYSLVALFALTRLFAPGTERGSRRLWLFVFCAAAVAQLWAGFYLGWFLALTLMLAFLGALLVPAYRRALWGLVRLEGWALLVAGALSAAALAPMALHYLEAAKSTGLRTFAETLTMIPPPQAWFHHGPVSWFYGGLARAPLFAGIPMEHEQRAGLGFLTLLLTLGGFIAARRRPALLFIGLVFFALMGLATLYGEFTPWRLIYEVVPGAKAIRAVARISLMMLIPVALGVALFLDHLWRRGGGWVVGACCLGMVSVVEQGQTTPAFDFQQNREDIAAIARQIKPDCQAFVLSPVQGNGPYWKYQNDAMWAQLQTGVPTLNGYSGSSPPGWPLGDINVHSEADERRVAMSIAYWANQHRLDAGRICWVRVGFQESAELRAQFVEQQVPPEMVAGQSYPVTVSMKNVGTRAWELGQDLLLGSQMPRDSNRWQVQRVALPGPVEVGGIATFRFVARAPMTPGTHPFQWRMVQERVTWFGELSEAVQVEVRASLATGASPASGNP